jgi:carbon monoxide dehydrogenase subunit G
MGDVNAQVVREIDQPIDKIWAVVSDFANVGWAMPGIKVTSEGSGVGMVRTMHIPNSDPVAEILETLDPVNYSFSYTIPKMAMPMTGFRGKAKLEKISDSRTRVIWGAEGQTTEGGDAAQLNAMFEGLYGQLVASLNAEVSK